MRPTCLLFLALVLQGTAAFQSASPRKFIDLSTALNAASVSPTSDGKSTDSAISGNNKISVVLCPAQFCVPADYNELFENLRTTRSAAIAAGASDLPEIASCRVAPLPRTEWIKVARQLPTSNFLKATLDAKSTLGWYFEAIEKALAEIYAVEGSDIKICFIGHSIGGWVARGYLGDLAG